MRELIISFIGADQPGLVATLADTLARHGGNWDESRLVHLSGQFAGAARVQVDASEVASLREALTAIPELTVVIRDAAAALNDVPRTRMRLNVVGPDRSGILRDVSRELGDNRINVVELQSRVAPAAMSGALTFSADVEVDVPAALDLARLSDSLEAIADALGVDIQLDAG